MKFSTALQLNYCVQGGDVLFEDGVVYLPSEIKHLAEFSDEFKRRVHRVKMILGGEIVGVKKKKDFKQMIMFGLERTNPAFASEVKYKNRLRRKA